MDEPTSVGLLCNFRRCSSDWNPPSGSSNAAATLVQHRGGVDGAWQGDQMVLSVAVLPRALCTRVDVATHQAVRDNRRLLRSH